jgi:hypothetical protein
LRGIEGDEWHRSIIRSRPAVCKRNENDASRDIGFDPRL